MFLYFNKTFQNIVCNTCPTSVVLFAVWDWVQELQRLTDQTS